MTNLVSLKIGERKVCFLRTPLGWVSFNASCLSGGKFGLIGSMHPLASLSPSLSSAISYELSLAEEVDAL